MKKRTPSVVVVSLSALCALSGSAAVGCGGSTSPGDETIGVSRAALHRAKGCDDLLEDLKADAKFKVNRAINQQVMSLQACVARYGEEGCGFGDVRDDFGGGRGAMDAGAAAPPQAENSSAGAGGDSAGKDSASSYSETNTQVKGVDEADIVKNDGKNLYVLHGRSFKVVNAWPAAELAEASTFDVEGYPSEMFVADGKVVIYSSVNGADVFKAAGVEPKSQYREYYGGGFGGGFASGGAVSDVAGPMMPYYPGGPYHPLTKMTVLELDGTTPRLVREVYFEGSYLDARRVGPNVRTVLRGYAYGPTLKQSIYELDAATASGFNAPRTPAQTYAAYERLRAQNLAAIDASDLGDYLPNTFVKEGATVRAQTVACHDFYVPTVGTTQSGIVEVASLNLDDLGSLPRETAILGSAETVYGSADTLYLATHAWNEPFLPWSFGGGVTAESGPALPIVAHSPNKTHVHKFEFASDPTFPNYVASGTVAGSVKDQFSLDDKDGFLRVSTTEAIQYRDANGRYFWPEVRTTPTGEIAADAPAAQWPSTVNHVFVMKQEGAWLEPVGVVNGLAPNERIFSTRFVGNRGYVVTFRQVDPLFVIDLASPSEPKVLAALKIPGFSEYMHPLDENHILTIGRDASPEGRVRGLQLQIFDVTDGRNPIKKHATTYSGDEYGYSEAQYDHKAFTYFAERNLLAFPYLAYDSQGTGGTRSTLELFRVDAGAGFQKLAAIDHSSLLTEHPQGYCGGYYGPSVRRGVFLGNFVYSISYGGVVVKDVDDLAAPGFQLPLASPQVNEGYGPSCY